MSGGGGGIDWEEYAKQQYSPGGPTLLPRMPRFSLTACMHIAWTLVPVISFFDKMSSTMIASVLLCASVHAQFSYHMTKFEGHDGERQYPFGKTLLRFVVVILVVYTTTRKPGEVELCWDHHLKLHEHQLKPRGYQLKLHKGSAHTRLSFLAALTVFEHFLRLYVLSPSSSEEEEEEEEEQE